MRYEHQHRFQRGGGHKEDRQCLGRNNMEVDTKRTGGTWEELESDSTKLDLLDRCQDGQCSKGSKEAKVNFYKVRK